MPKTAAHITLRTRWIGTAPQRGDYMRRDGNPRLAFHIQRVIKPTSSSRSSSHDLTLVLAKVKPLDIPDGATVHLQRVSPRVPKPPAAVRSADPGQPEAPKTRLARLRAKAPVLLGIALEPVRAGKRAQRQATADRIARWHEGDDVHPMVPAAQILPVRDRDGEVVSLPKTVHDEWRDPDDMDSRRREPRLVKGPRRTSALEYLATKNGLIEDKHIKAADRYSIQWEAGPGGARPGYAREMVNTHASTTPSGPSEAILAGMTAWNRVQSRLQARQRAILDCVVLQNQPITRWAKQAGTNPTMETGYLVSVLETLVMYYQLDKPERV